MKPATAGTPYTVPPEPSRLPAFMLAVVVHALLLGFLWFGISWQNTEPVAVQAEVWDMSVQSAAAPELPPPPAPEPEPQPEPAPPPPRVIEPPPVERPAPTPPDINLQREKERKEQEKRELAEKREQERKDKERKELAEQKKKEEADNKALAKKEAEDKKKADEKKKADKLAAEKAAKEKAAKEKAEQAKLDKIRQEDLKRMAGAMGTTGSAEKSTGPRSDDGYVAALTAAIKSATAYGGSTTMPGNPKAVFRVDQLPTGEVMSVRLVKSSGVPEFDRAVENGIKKASPLPKKKNGTVERTIDVNFSMKDYD